MALITRYIDPDASGAGNGTSWADAYTSLNTWEAAENTNLVSDGDSHIVWCRSSSGTADTVAVTINSWILDDTHTLTVKAEAGHEALKSGWDATRYRLQVTDSNCLTIWDTYVSTIGLQVDVLFSSSGSKYGIITDNLASSNLLLISNCRIEASNAGTSRGIGIVDADSNIIIQNCVTKMDSRGIYVANGTSVDIENCIIYGTDVGDGVEFDAGTGTITNCAVINHGDDFDIAGGATVTIDHCASDDGDGTNSIAPSGADWDNEYADSANGDFTLLEGGNCFQGGTDVSLSTDIEGDAYHSTAPSVGVDELKIITRYIDPDATGAGDGTSWADAYTSMNSWEAAEQTNLVTDEVSHVALCRASSGTADTTTVVVTGWTTDTTHTITIQAEVGDEALKTGWEDTRYRLSVTDNQCIDFNEEVNIIGLQLESNYSSADFKNVLVSNFFPSAADILIDSCRVRTTGGGSYRAINLDEADLTFIIQNTICEASSDGIRIDDCTSGVIYNCITSNCGGSGVELSVNATNVTVKNCAGFNNSATDMTDGASNTIDYCATDDGNGTNSIAPSGADWDNEYVDPDNGDFTLLDSGNCYQGGTDVSLATDMEGDDYHATTPSVGVDEFVEEGGETVSIAGSSDSITLLSGTINIDTQLAGSSDSVTLLSGTLNIDTQLAGSSDSITLLSGTLNIDTQLAGSSDSVTLLSGSLDVVANIISLAGTSDSVTLLSGTLNIDTQLAGSSDSVTLLSGTLNIDTQLTGSSDSVTLLSGTLTSELVIFWSELVALQSPILLSTVLFTGIIDQREIETAIELIIELKTRIE